MLRLGVGITVCRGSRVVELVVEGGGERQRIYDTTLIYS